MGANRHNLSVGASLAARFQTLDYRAASDTPTAGSFPAEGFLPTYRKGVIGFHLDTMQGFMHWRLVLHGQTVAFQRAVFAQQIQAHTNIQPLATLGIRVCRRVHHR